MDPDADPDPAFFSPLAFKMLTKNLLFECTFTSFFKEKSQSSRDQGFAYYFCLVIEGSGSKALTNGSGCPKTYGSDGSGSQTMLARSNTY
jgi:hypothetical protein